MDFQSRIERRRQRGRGTLLPGRHQRVAQLGGRNRKQIVSEVRAELAAIWPAAASATLLASRVVTENAAVFSARPGLERIRPSQQTPAPGVLVAGDWTATGWPSTMESAVRSGYLAAEAVASAIGESRRFLVSDLPRGILRDV